MNSRFEPLLGPFPTDHGDVAAVSIEAAGDVTPSVADGTPVDGYLVR